MATITLGNQNLVLATPLTYLSSNTAASVSTLSVQNTTGFSTSQILIIGGLGNQGSEIVKTSVATSPTSAVITLYSSTSTTSLAIATGSKAFTTQSSLAWQPGERVRATSDANSANYMEGVVASYSGTTLTVTVDTIGGSGTLTDWTIRQVTIYPHSASASVQLCQYDRAEFSTATAVSGSKTVLATIAIWADNQSTNYIDNTASTGYYFGRFKNTIAGTFSAYSDPIPVQGYGIYTARSIIDSALGEINKTTSDVLSDQFAFQQLDMFQTDVLKELKRWSFMQKFDEIIGQFNVGEWEIDMPTDIDDPNTNQSVYNIRVGANGRLTWIDKAKWDDFIFNLAYSQLAVDLSAGDLTMTLDNSHDFNHLTDSNTDGSGTIKIGNQSYEYSANNVETGVITLTTTIDADNEQDAGAWAFQNANFGLPNYYTIFDGKVHYWPITADQYDGVNAFMDYYSRQTRITQDSDEIVVPDPLAASYYLQWKFLKKLGNGTEDESSKSAQNNYLARRDKLKTKVTNNRTFKMSPRFQNFAIQEQWDSGDPRFIRDGAFPNTGLG